MENNHQLWRGYGFFEIEARQNCVIILVESLAWHSSSPHIMQFSVFLGSIYIGYVLIFN